MPRRKVTDIKNRAAESGRLPRLPRRQESVGDPTLVEDLDGAGVEATRAGFRDRPGRAPLHDRHIDARESQLTGQHHSGRTAPHDDHSCHVVPFS